MTKDAPTAYDKVLALEAWLAANTTYRLDVAPPPDGADAVDQFLFVDRQGFCEQIATALTVMLRTLGIPARLAVGFVPDHRDPVSGDWVVLDKGAHAWVEVLWPGVGWQGFDPTADVPLSGEYQASLTSQVSSVIGIILAIALVILAVAAGWLVPFVAERRRRRRLPWTQHAAERLTRAGATAGRAHAPSETLDVYAAALEGSPLAGHGAPEVGSIVSRATFGGADPPPADRAHAEAILTDLHRTARRTRRSRWRRGRGAR